jgi:hypothetical protein
MRDRVRACVQECINLRAPFDDLINTTRLGAASAANERRISGKKDPILEIARQAKCLLGQMRVYKSIRCTALHH